MKTKLVKWGPCCAEAKFGWLFLTSCRSCSRQHGCSLVEVTGPYNIYIYIAESIDAFRVISASVTIDLLDSVNTKFPSRRGSVFPQTRFGFTMMDISSEKKALDVTCLLYFFYELTFRSNGCTDQVWDVYSPICCACCVASDLLHHYQGKSSRATCLHSFRRIMEKMD
jgi:hypothetical protein